MTVTLYNNSADPRVVQKQQSLVQIASVSAEPYYPIEVSTPVFRLAYNANYTRINYMYVPEFQRYYFVTNITLESGNAMIIKCECDVLMSFKNDILNLRAICFRNETDYNKYMPDFTANTVKSTTKAYLFEDLFQASPFGMPTDENTYCYTLTVAGLKGAEQNV